MPEYVKTNWQTGDIITAEKLNNIQNGIVNNSNGGVRVIDLTALPAVQDNPAALQYEPNLTMNDLIGAHVVFPNEGFYARNTIVAATILNGSDEIVCKLDSTADAGLIRYNTSTGYITGE